MKAIMRDNLVARYKAVMPKEYDAEIGAFLLSIEGKEVELRFIGTDAFEVNDNSIWLPDCLWDEPPVEGRGKAAYLSNRLFGF